MDIAKSDHPSSPPNDESAGEEEEALDNVEEQEEALDNVEEQEDIKPIKVAANVNELLKKLHSTNFFLKNLIKKEHRCVTCDETFSNWAELEAHLLQHVTLPSVVLNKLPSEDEDAPSGDEPWSDEEDDLPPAPAQKTPQKIDIAQLMKQKGITISPGKSQNGATTSSDSAISKLSSLGLSIKKNTTPIKQEKSDQEPQTANDVMQKLGKLGGLKLKIKSDGTNTNSFKVVNGLRDFKTSDDEDEGNDGDKSEEGKDQNEDDPDSEDDQNDSKSSNDDTAPNEEIVNAINQKLQDKVAEKETAQAQAVKPSPSPVKQVLVARKPPGRPAVKQTPMRGANHPIAAKQTQAAVVTTSNVVTMDRPSSRDSISSATTEILSVKQETETNDPPSTTTPLFSSQIKSERTSPPPENNTSTPVISHVKTESLEPPTGSTQPIFRTAPTIPLMPVTKQEDTGMTIIEINEEDDDDDCCVVSATPAPDVKPVIPKIETVTPNTTYVTPAYSTTQPSYSTTSSLLDSGFSHKKQHSFDWNAPDTKSNMDIFNTKTTDDLFDSIFSSKKENQLLSDASEYISLDTLGPKHTCEVCNTRFTNIPMLEEHKRMTGHSSSLVMPNSSNLLPYGQSSSILSSLLPVKQLAEQVGKLSTINSSAPGFTHQQNVMINIQAYPGGGGMMAPPPSYNSYQQPQNMHPGFQQQPQQNPMYGAPGQQMPNQFSGQMPNQNYMGQPQQSYGQQFQQPMSNPVYVSNAYSAQSPLQGMQQAVYSQSPGMMPNQQGQMGPPLSMPPGSAQSPYKTASSPSGINQQGNNIRIQNVQTFAPGQMGGIVQGAAPGQTASNQMPPPGPIRMAAGANVSRPRMIGVRGSRPTMKIGGQMQGQMRGIRPRMPMKRPMGMMGGPGQKRRPDMLLPGKHDNEDCQVMAMQKQREGMPMIHSVQGAKDKVNLPSGISVTKKPVNKAAAMANVLASRGISIKQKAKSRSPSPERPIPHIPNLPAGMSIKHSSKSSSFSIPEGRVGGMVYCKMCKKGFSSQNMLAMHMASVHGSSKIPMFKCDECPASYPKSLQLQHHKRTFHNVTGSNRELGLPVVDLSQEDSLRKLSSLGIYSFIPLANRENVDGSFGIPVISVHNMQNGVVSGLHALGADGLLSLGPLKPLPNS